MKATAWQRERMVGRSLSGREERRIKRVRSGGSSSVLRKELAAAVFMVSASSRIITFQHPSREAR
jgi:hypothetical protein